MNIFNVHFNVDVVSQFHLKQYMTVLGIKTLNEFASYTIMIVRARVITVKQFLEHFQVWGSLQTSYCA